MDSLQQAFIISVYHLLFVSKTNIIGADEFKSIKSLSVPNQHNKFNRLTSRRKYNLPQEVSLLWHLYFKSLKK